MARQTRGVGWRLLGSLLLVLETAAAASDEGQAVLELLQARCVICHAGPDAPLRLRLDSPEGIRAGSVNGPVVQPGAPQASALWRRVKGLSLPRMPLTGPPFLDDAQIALIERWISAGAVLPEVAVVDNAEAAAPSGPPTWMDVAPILLSRCAKCHTGNGVLGPPPEGYRLDSYAATLASTERARVVPGNPQASELLRRVRGQARPRMPFDGPPFFDATQLDLLERWIAAGARDEQGRPAAVPVGARVRLHGRLDGDGRLDGLPLRLDPDTRRETSARPGEYVQVRGRLEADGQVRAERLRKR